jgi:hypothetical protein
VCLVVGCLIVAAGSSDAVIADFRSVSGPASSLGAFPVIIAPPSDVLDQCVTSAGQVGFQEAQGVITPSAFAADDKIVIPAGTLVDSHMIFFNRQLETFDDVSKHSDVVWAFKRRIIGVMSDMHGNLEAASTSALGAPGTNYSLPATASCVPFGPIGAAPYTARGLDTTQAGFPYTHLPCLAQPPDASYDCYTVETPTTIRVRMELTQPGDWIRVITEGAIDVAIDIKPGSDPNCFNINGAGVVPVAILGSATFDVTQIDTSALDFAGLDVRVRGSGAPQCGISDTNQDGFNDMVCQFQDNPDAWRPGTTTAELTGLLLDSMPFEGSDAICVVR